MLLYFVAGGAHGAALENLVMSSGVSGRLSVCLNVFVFCLQPLNALFFTYRAPGLSLAFFEKSYFSDFQRHLGFYIRTDLILYIETRPCQKIMIFGF